MLFRSGIPSNLLSAVADHFDAAEAATAAASPPRDPLREAQSLKDKIKNVEESIKLQTDETDKAWQQYQKASQKLEDLKTKKTELIDQLKSVSPVVAKDGIDANADSCMKFVEKFRDFANSGAQISPDSFNDLVSMLPVQEFHIDSEMRDNETLQKDELEESESEKDRLPWIKRVKKGDTGSRARDGRSRSPPPVDRPPAADVAGKAGRTVS